jgi:hypothetical protein
VLKVFLLIIGFFRSKGSEGCPRPPTLKHRAQPPDAGGSLLRTQSQSLKVPANWHVVCVSLLVIVVHDDSSP